MVPHSDGQSPFNRPVAPHNWGDVKVIFLIPYQACPVLYSVTIALSPATSIVYIYYLGSSGFMEIGKFNYEMKWTESEPEGCAGEYNTAEMMKNL